MLITDIKRLPSVLQGYDCPYCIVISTVRSVDKVSFSLICFCTMLMLVKLLHCFSLKSALTIGSDVREPTKTLHLSYYLNFVFPYVIVIQLIYALLFLGILTQNVTLQRYKPSLNLLVCNVCWKLRIKRNRIFSTDKTFFRPYKDYSFIDKHVLECLSYANG